MTITEDVFFNMKFKLIQLSFLDHVLSICNVCNCRLFHFPTEIEMTEEQEYSLNFVQSQCCMLVWHS